MKETRFRNGIRHLFATKERAIKMRASGLTHREIAAELKVSISSAHLFGKIIDFYKMHNRIPLKKEFNMHREYKRQFGSWNAAIRIAGFETNPELFAHKFRASDGHQCDSFTEKIIDDWMLERGILHERNFKYGTTKMTADFFIEPNILIEFFGLAGVQKNYDEIIKKKRKFCEEVNLVLIEIYPMDIFPKNKLDGFLCKLSRQFIQ